MTESKKKKSCEKICEKKNFVFAISKKWKMITIMLITNNIFLSIMIKWMIFIMIPMKMF